MVAAADATGSQELLSQQLPLGACSCSAVQLTSRGLQATGAAADAAASEAAVAALEQQRPATVQQGQALRLALGQVRATGTVHASKEVETPDPFISTSSALCC
jgi:ABC-type uncharacterized transport system YnjBCD ATPase subunit